MSTQPRTCPRCAACLKAAPLTFTLAYTCNGCGLILARSQDAARVVEELAALRGGQNAEASTLQAAPVVEIQAPARRAA